MLFRVDRRRRHHYQAANIGRMLYCELLSNDAAHRVTDNDGGRKLEALQQGVDVLGEQVDGAAGIQSTRITVPSEIEGQDSVGTLQERDLPSPELPIACPAVEQYHRDPGPGERVRDPCSPFGFIHAAPWLRPYPSAWKFGRKPS